MKDKHEPVDGVGGGREAGSAGPTWRGIPRAQIDWAPRIDGALCEGCRKCLDFCSFGVFAYSHEEAVVRVASPQACVVGCSLCESLCDVGAITFPPLSYLDGLAERAG